jgi:hypothetical protein
MKARVGGAGRTSAVAHSRVFRCLRPNDRFCRLAAGRRAIVMATYVQVRRDRE